MIILIGLAVRSRRSLFCLHFLRYDLDALGRREHSCRHHGQLDFQRGFVFAVRHRVPHLVFLFRDDAGLTASDHAL